MSPPGWLVSSLVVTCVGALAASCTAADGDQPEGEREARSTPSEANGADGSRARERDGVDRNPVLNRDFPDPTVIRTSQGAFYAYATQVIRDSGNVNIQLARSHNLLDWTYLGEALPSKPSWAQTTQDFWAPHVTERDGTFFLYYSAIPDDAAGDVICLAVATSDRPEGPFGDVGEPLLCSGGTDIDPATFRDPRSGEWFLYWAASGDIVAQRLDEDMVHLQPGEPTFLLAGYSASVKRPYEDLVEGPFVVRRRGWFYLFYSGDRCCEYPGHYAVLVARSRRPLGPFRRFGPVTGRSSSVILEQNGRWNAPGHGSLVRDRRGRDWFAYHAIDRRQPYLPAGLVRRVMMLDRVSYRRGWPRIADGVPSRRPARSRP